MRIQVKNMWLTIEEFGKKLGREGFYIIHSKAFAIGQPADNRFIRRLKHVEKLVRERKLHFGAHIWF